MVSGKVFSDLSILEEIETELVRALARYIRIAVNSNRGTFH